MRNTFSLRLKHLLALPLLLFLMAISMVSRGQTITLDQADLDYAPGETVYITGTDFLPGEFVTMTISHIEPGLPLIYHEHALIYATADSTGTFNASWYVEEVELNTTLSLLAEGDQGSLASVVFTDANKTDTYPSSFNSISGENTYCKGDNASILRVQWRNTNCKITSSENDNINIPITITWYKNSTNSNVGGTSVYEVYATAATTASNYTPLTTTVGTWYYYAEVSWGNGKYCASAGKITSSTQSIVVYAIPDTPTISANGPTTFCTGGSVTLTSSAGSSYLWSTGATTQSINVTSGGNYTVQVTNNNGCISEPSAPTTVTVNPLPPTPTITAEGSTTLCTGGSVTLTSSVGSSYLWSTGETTRSINVSTSGNYSVRVTNANGCQSDVSAITTVTVRPIPSAAIEITGNYTICSGLTTTIKISGPPNGIVIYNINGGSDITGSINNGGNLNLTTANLTANTTYNLVSVAYGDAPGCSNSVNGSVKITVNQPPVITTQPANQTVTYGGSASFMVASTGIPAPTYQWQINTGLGFTNITGATASTLDVQDPTVAMNGYKYRVIVNNICSTITSNEVSLTVNARPVTITADAQSKTYGDSDPSLTYQITSGSLAYTDALSGNLTRVVGEDVGAYAINQGTVALNSNYSLTYVGANLNIGKRPVTITADAKSKTYGDADPALTYEITTGTLAFNDTFIGALTRDAGEDVGSHAITQGTVDLGNNYMLTYIGANLSITSRPVTITADIQSKVYGDADPALTYQITSGSLAFSDDFTGALTRAAGEVVGSYAITQGSVTLSTNYTLTYVGDDLTIGKRSVQITADAQSKIYGDTDPALTYQITKGSLAFTDAFAGALTRDAGEDVGSYAITQGTVALNNNYTLTYVGANLTIGKRSVEITADTQSKIYGDGDPVMTYQITSGSLAFSDVFTGILIRDEGENVGSYAITQGSVALTDNYTLSYLPANLSITKRAVTITADAQSKVYGEPDPALTYQITSGNLAFSDAITGVLTRDAGEDVGKYSILQGTVELSSNYDLSYVAADLTITKRAVTITADAQSKVYGEPDPALTYQITSGNLAFSDAITGVLTRDAGENVGSYAITQGSVALNPNYDLSYVGDKLTINKRAVTITADAQSKIYGDADPALTYQITSGSLAFTDAFAGALTRDAGENVGSYAITQGNVALNPNYDLSYVGDKLTINKRAVTIAADAKSKVYGDADPALTYQITSGSLAFSDAFTGSLTRDAGENVGSYAITQGGVALNSNYTLTYVGANLYIDRRAITITADTKSKYAGQIDPPLTYQTTSGKLVNGDTFSGSLSRLPGECCGTYGIIQGTVSLSSNYTLSFVGANITIMGVSIDASASSTPVAINTPVLTLCAKVSDGLIPLAGVSVKFCVEDGNGVKTNYGPVFTADGNNNTKIGVASIPLNNLTSKTDVLMVTAIVGEGCVDVASSIAYLAIYDPNGGFVTGGGWIMSPPKAYAANPALTGKANFGFISKYKKGSNVPEGNTEFQFQTGNLNFSSSTYSLGSLVIAGSKATYKGVGTINGSGNYAFMVSAVDGDVSGGGGIDKFRIKIWDANKVIYDNDLGADENDLPTIALGGGSIVIHSNEKVNKDAHIPDASANAFEPTLKVYPNPFTDRLNIEFSYATDTKAKLEIYSVTGAKLQTLYDGPVTGGQLYNFEYVPRLVSSQVVFYQLTLDGKTQVGKILYNEKR